MRTKDALRGLMPNASGSHPKPQLQGFPAAPSKKLNHDKVLRNAIGSALVLAAWDQVAQGQTTNFNYTGDFQYWTVPADGVYRITAFGAQGGSANAGGGFGAEIGGGFSLTSGQVLSIAVGGAGYVSWGGFGGGGGGGGSFNAGLNPMVTGFRAGNGLVEIVMVPKLSITNSAPGFATVSWAPASTNWVLQENLNLGTTNWVNSPSGTNNPVTVPADQPAKFYRLLKL
jgi:hypothetical protein